MTTTDEPIIEVKHLAKRYRIGLDRTYKTFSECAVNVLKSPVQALLPGYDPETVFERHAGPTCGLRMNGDGRRSECYEDYLIFMDVYRGY